MPARVAMVTTPSSGAFPRWGYLDKFDVSEYMARALAMTVLLCAVLGGVLQWVQSHSPAPDCVPVLPASTPCIQEVYFGPPPSVIPRVRLEPAPGGGPTVRPHLFIPLPVAGIDADIAPSGGGPGTGPPSADGFELADGPSPADVVAVQMPAWPSPDDVIVVEKEPQLIAMQPPAYPEIAREAGVEGTVLVRVLVDTQGTVRDRQLLLSVRGLDEAALSAANTAVFRPALQQDKPVAVWVVLPIEFRLHGDGAK